MPSPILGIISSPAGKQKFASVRRPETSSYGVETDAWGEDRFDTALTYAKFRTLYRDSDLARRFVDLPVDYAFRNGLLSPDVPHSTLNDLRRLFKGVRIFGESVAVFSGDTFQVVFPSDADGQVGYTTVFDAAVETGIKVRISGVGLKEYKVGEYARIMSDVMSPSDPYAGLSALKNQYWNLLAHSECVHALCGQVRIMSGGFFYWNIADTELDIGTNSTVGDYIADGLKKKAFVVRGDPASPEPKIISPDGRTYSMVDFLDYLIKLIGAEDGIPGVLLKGSDDGKLATSDVTLRCWYDRVRCYQDRIKEDVASVLGVDDVDFADPAGVETETCGKLADCLLKLKDIAEKETLEELASRIMPNIKWRIKDVSELTTPGVGPLGGGDPVGSEKPDGVPGPKREKADGDSY